MRTRVSAVPLSAEAYNSVRRRILSGRLKLGQVISRRTLASEMGMSFLPVSEALLRLETEGLIESRPRAGTRVRIPTREDVIGHYVVREALEVEAARIFAKTMPLEGVDSLHRLAIKLDHVTPDEDRLQYSTLHEKVHSKIAAYAGCPALCEAIEKTHALASAWMCVGPSHHSGPTRRHQLLVEALISGDVADAAEAMRDHIHSSQQAALERLIPYFDLQTTRGECYRRGQTPE